LAPALAIIDLNVPKHDGAEILKKIRTSRRLADLPVLIMSSSSSPRDRARLFELGIGRYVTKPADLDEFLKIGQVVKELLGGQ
jgi:DNA-binding response OmpR family regulator